MKILIVGPSWVGDSVMAQSLFKTIHSKFEAAVIDVLSPDWTINIFKRMDEVSETMLLPFNHGQVKLKERIRIGSDLKKKNYDQAIILPNSLKSSLVPFFAKIPLRTGWRGEMRYFLINDLRILNKDQLPRMVDRFVALALGKQDSFPSLIPNPSLRVEKENLLAVATKHSINLNEPLIAFCPGAEFGPSKRWPAEYFAEVANEYLSKNWQVLFLGSSNDIPVGLEIEERLGKHLGLFNLIGRTKIEDSIDLISSSKLVLTNDSGLMHIAASVGAKLVALFGPSSPAFTPPLSDIAKVLSKNEGYSKVRTGSGFQGYHQSLIDIKPEEVIELLHKINSSSRL